MSLATLATAVLVGWIGVEITGDTIEKRLTVDMTRNASRMMAKLNLSPGDGVMEHLSGIFGAQTATMSPGGRRLLGSSLPDNLRDRCAALLVEFPDAKYMTMGGTSYRLGSIRIPYDRPSPGRPRNVRLYLLLPAAEVRAARDTATRRIVIAMLPAVIAAVALAAILSLTVTLPITRLSRRAQELSRDISKKYDDEQPEQSGTVTPFSSGGGPVEVVRLSASLDHLLADLKTANRQLMATRRMADLGRLAASAAHELRNPLSGIKMNARVLRDRIGGEPECLELMDIIFGEIERMDLYLRELMLLARNASTPERRLFKPGKRESSSLPDIAKDAVRLLRGRFEHAGVTVETDVRPGISRVFVDPIQVRQVVINLMINAMEAGGAGGRISLSIHPGDNGGTTITIADNGGGVRVSHGADIFDPFVSTKSEGAGLGLHICNMIAEGHGGTIGYRNTAAGAEFHFTLPPAAVES